MWMGSIRMDMAVGIIIGGAFTSIVSSLVEDIINPFLGIFGGMNFDKLHWNIVGDVTLNYGKFLTAVMNFLIMAFVVFILVKALNTGESVKYRCPHCTSILDAKAVEAFEKNL